MLMEAPPPGITYSSALKSLELGLPLWDPDKNPGIEVGDVGFVQDGGFTCVFNVFALEDLVPQQLSPGDHTNLSSKDRLLDRPENLGCLQLGKPATSLAQLYHRTPEYLTPGIIYSRAKIENITEAPSGHPMTLPSYTLSCSSKSGAALYLERGAYREVLRSTKDLKAFMLKHYDSWRSLFQKAGHDTSNPLFEGPVLVTQCIKAPIHSGWGAVVWTKKARFNHVILESDDFSGIAVTPPVDGSEAGIYCRTSKGHRKMDVEGGETKGPNLAPDPCLFLSYLKVRKSGLFGRLKIVQV